MNFLSTVAKALFKRANEPSTESLFRYTSGRWIYNEAEQLAVRHVEFNVAALKRVAAQAAGARSCTCITKTHEGSYNKIYLLEFDNKSSLIAKIPTKLIPPFYTTASEVATMDYARTVLDLPVPRVLAWNARDDPAVNPVGAEYILMEKCEGQPLHKRWGTLTGDATAVIVNQAVGLEQRFMFYKFSQIGSLYYKEDVDEALQARPLYSADNERTGGDPDKYRIGPLVDWDVWRGTRSSLQVDRGPWPNPVSYIQSLLRIEQEWLRQCAKPFPPPFHNWPNGSTEEHIELLERLHAMTPHIAPPPELWAPVLWHIDLHGGNILLDPTEDPAISSIIDWQSVSIQPLYIQATIARFAQYTGNDVVVKPGLVKPALRIPLDESPPEERPRIELELRNARIQKLYEVDMKRYNPWHYAVHVYPFIEEARNPVQHAARSWYESSNPLRESLLQIVKKWDEIAPGVTLPFSIDEAEWERHKSTYARWEKYDARIQALRKVLGINLDGWVSNERYEEVKAKCAQVMDEWDEEKEGGPYPFRDGAPSWFVGS